MRSMSSIGRDVAGDHGGWIAGRQIEQREHDERDHRDDDDGREQAPDEIAAALRLGYFFSTFQRKAMGAMITPEMLVR